MATRTSAASQLQCFFITSHVVEIFLHEESLLNCREPEVVPQVVEGTTTEPSLWDNS